MFQYSMMQPVIWMLTGLLTAIFFLGMRYWFQDLKIKMHWWKWLLIVVWITMLALTLGVTFTLIGENESKAGIRFVLFFGLIILLTGGGLWKIIAKK